ncbi:MAG: hypothetical protein M1830_009975 [Pleopsidium flavum]|nr:MAG: hypothetical protein M1830_009975 [Pleopsidium flavum]
MPKVPPLEELAHASYWDKRYHESDGKDALDNNGTGTYDWFKSFVSIRPFLEYYLPAVNRTPEILHLGCGNSTLPHELRALGYTNQVSIDFSSVVIEKMESKHHEMTWQVMDVRHLRFEDNMFEVAIDKGTLDAMLHGSLWDPPEDVMGNVGKYADEVARVLKPGGKWLYITYRQPHFIKPMLQRPEVWSMTVETLADEPGGGGMLEYFGFVMRKHIDR